MHRQVVVGAVGDALQLGELAAAEVEAVLDVHRALGVVGQLLLGVLEEAHVLGAQAEVDVPVPALLEPVLVPGLVLARLDEELHLHLLELAGAEDEVAGRDLVAEALADLGDAERRLLARSGLHGAEVGEDALRGLRAEVGQAGRVLGDAEVRLQHARELLGLREGALVAAVRAVDVGEAVGRDLAVLGLVGLFQVVGAEALVTGEALGQRVVEGRDVAGGLPDLAGEDHRGVETDDILPSGDHRTPPLALDVLLELDSQRTVVPGGAGTAVDLAAGVDEATALAQADDRVDLVGGHSALFSTTARSGRGWLRAPEETQGTGDAGAGFNSIVARAGGREAVPGVNSRACSGVLAPRPTAPSARLPRGAEEHGEHEQAAGKGARGCRGRLAEGRGGRSVTPAPPNAS